jgi:uncharacterized protein YndB with AHSA1/START domain
MEVRREAVFGASSEEVWAALTDPERLADWFANDVELELRPGGEGVFRWDDGSVRIAEVDAVEEGRRFAFRWREEDGDATETQVELVLADIEGGTRVTVSERANAGVQATALAGEWSWGVQLLAALPRLRLPARAA